MPSGTFVVGGRVHLYFTPKKEEEKKKENIIEQKRKKYRIWETPNISTDADSSTDNFLPAVLHQEIADYGGVLIKETNF